MPSRFPFQRAVTRLRPQIWPQSDGAGRASNSLLGAVPDKVANRVPRSRRMWLAVFASLAAVAGVSWACLPAGLPSIGFASAVPPRALELYQAGLALKRTQPQAALRDFQQAAQLAPDWEAPLYEEGALLAVLDFRRAIPVLRAAARLNPHDDAVWNVLGWGYYQHGDFSRAESAFRQQLAVRPGSPYALWGLANCEANSQMRMFAQARSHLRPLLKVPDLAARAKKMMAQLPPDAVDAHVAPNAPVTYEDAIAMLLSYRSDVLASGSKGAAAIHAADGQPPSPPVRPYIAWAVRHGLVSATEIPSFRKPATRLFLALLMAKYYGLNAFSYARPFPFNDMSGVPVDEQMVVQSVIANRLLTPATPNQFRPSGPMTRSALAAAVAHANQVMVHPPQPNQWLAPALPPRRHRPWLYFFNTSDPPYRDQTADVSDHAALLNAIGFTAFPFFADLPSGVARTRQSADGTQYLSTIRSAAPDEDAEWDRARSEGVQPFLVLGNYDQAANRPDPSLVHKLLQNGTERAKLVAEAVRVARACGAAGITVDFEQVLRQDRAALTSFVTALHHALAGTGLKLMVCLPERDRPDPASAYDFAALGSAADLVMVITYDEHTPGSAPGPISDLANTDRVLKYTVMQIPPSKVLVGAADYGYDWVTDVGKPGVGKSEADGGWDVPELSMVEAQRLARLHHAQIRWDDRSQTPWFTYHDARGRTHQVWFEDQRSIAAVARLVANYGLRGMAVWHLGAEDAGFWRAWAALAQAGSNPSR